jgi:DNA-binding transcriptional LysR family regulator
MKHTETLLGMKLFQRRNGRYMPTQEARAIFNQVNGVYDKVEDLQYVIQRLKRGTDAELRLGSVPSLSTVMVPRAIADVRRTYPALLIDVDVLKIEEAIDYLLLGKGEVVAMSYRFDHPMLSFQPLATGTLKCIVPATHALAKRRSVSVRDIVKFPLIGIDPNDPYGRIMANLMTRDALSYDVTIRARFGSTVCALVTAGLGVAVIDVFTLAGGNWPDIRLLDIEEPTAFETYFATRKDVTLSSYCAAFIDNLQRHMTQVTGASRKARQK